MTGILGRYVVRTVLGYTALVMIVLLALGALFMFIGQQDDIGVGNYTATQALLFVALNLPSYLFQLLPVAALIGSLLGLGNLARGSELIVMRASGVTTLRFCLWLGTAGLILASLMFVIGEYVAPPLGQYARQLKVFAKFDEFNLAGNRATWVRDGDTIISVDQQSASTRFGGIKVFRVDPRAQTRERRPGRVRERQGRQGVAAREIRRHDVRAAIRSTATVDATTSATCARRCRRNSSVSRSPSPKRWACATCATTSRTCSATNCSRPGSRPRTGRASRGSSPCCW